MKKLIPKVIFFILIAAIIVGGKYFIDNKTYNFREEVKDSLTEYFIKGDINSLDNIVDLLNKYADDEEYRKNVQNYSANIVGSWFVYVDSKYNCNIYNKNSCIVQFNELSTLSKKFDELYKLKANDGYTIVVPSAYNSLKKEVDKKLYNLSNIMASNGIRDPQDIEQIRLNKCRLTNECERCYEGACTCYYTDNTTKVREELLCWGKSTK